MGGLDDGSENKFHYTPVTSADLEKNRRAMYMLCLVGGMVIILLLALFGVILMSVYSNGKSTTASQTSSNQTETIESNYVSNTEAPADSVKFITQSDVSQGQIPDHYRGNTKAKVVAIEYADFTCPYCKNLHSDANKIAQDYKDKVLFIYRNYNVGHTYSDITIKAAEAAYIVGGEDAYWKMADKLYEADEWANAVYMDQPQINQILQGYARDIGIDDTALIEAMNNSANNGIDDKINRDQDLAKQSSLVDGTPTWLINGKSVKPKADNIREALDSLLSSK